MYRSYEDIENMSGFVNKGLDISDNSQNTKQHTKIQIIRSKYNQESLFREMLYKKSPSKSFFTRFFGSVNKETFTTCAYETFPIFSWLGSYKKDDILSDFISGCTVAIMQVPQGMGYALLANLPPIIGIYMAFFPVLFYVFLGTSRHNSMGTFAVISIMVGKCVAKYSHSSIDPPDGEGSSYSPVEVATLICFIAGIIQLIMYVLRAGVLSFLLSESLVSGFTTGAAIHVFTSQIKDLLGIELRRINGHFEIIKIYKEIFIRIDQINVATLILSLITIVVLVVNNEVFKKKLAKLTKFPIPIELIVVVGGTLISKYTDIDDQYSIVHVGHIPLGWPDPTPPKFNLWREILLESTAIAFVSYSITVSMALIFGQKLKYEIDFNQELLAMGVGNVFASFFACFPYSASLSRSIIQQTSGGRTQLASLISCVWLLFVLLWIGPFFEVLPRCILASVIVVAIKGMLVQVTDFARFRRTSNTDGFVWIATFLSVVIISIDVGLLVGVCLSMAVLFLNGLKCEVCELGNIPNTDLFLDIEHFQKAKRIPNIKIIQFRGAITFATKASFRNQVCGKLGVNLLKELKYRENASAVKKSFKSNINFKHLILDFAPLTNIDASSINMLTDLIKDFAKLNITVHISACSTKIYEILSRNEFAFLNILYPSIQDIDLEFAI